MKIRAVTKLWLTERMREISGFQKQAVLKQKDTEAGQFVTLSCVFVSVPCIPFKMTIF